MQPGDILRYEREQKGLTIEAVAAQSGIKVSVLNAIETSETGDIPLVYLRGYIRNYARFLGVASPEFETKLENVQGKDPAVRTVFTTAAKHSHTERWLKASSYLAASALIATLAWQFTHEAVRFSQGDSQLTSSPSSAPVSGEPVLPEGVQETRQPNTHVNASIASMEMLSKRGELAGESPAEQAWAAISGPPEASAEDSPIHNLSITTSADTWVEISDAAGVQLELDLIRAGSSREYNGQPPFDVMIGRASAVELGMDGDNVDLGPHTRGNVARMTLQPQ